MDFKKLLKIKRLSSSSRPLKFEKFGKSLHLKIKDAEDLKNICELNEAHWLAINAPIDTINADSLFLKLLDTDHDGRIRADEVKQAIYWLLENLKDTSGVKPNHTTLDTMSICHETIDGKKINTSAKKILKHRESSGSTVVTLEKVRAIIKEEEKGGKDKAGMVLPTAAPDIDTAELLKDIIKTIGGEEHPSGELGVTLKCLNNFVKEIKTYYDWHVHGELSEEQQKSTIMPFGTKTHDFYKKFDFLREKFDQYFALCDMMRISEALTQEINKRKLALQEDLVPDAHTVNKFLAQDMIAYPNSSAVFHFETKLNPFYAEQIVQFRTEVLSLIFQESLSEMSSIQWRKVKNLFQPHQAWRDSKPKVCVDNLSVEKIQHYLKNIETVEKVSALIRKSYVTSFDLGNLRLLEKLILYQSYLIPFVNSFVSFPHLYDPNGRALFEMGTLIMDERNFTLSVKVPDRKQHAEISNASNMFVLYAEISSKEGVPLYEVAVPVTSGTRGNLQVNKWGIFHDIHDKECHARIVEIVENPISFREAFVRPFNRLGHTITHKLDELSSKAEANFEVVGATAVTTLGKIPQLNTKAKLPKSSQSTGGGLAGFGIAIAALSSSLAFITKTLSALSIHQILTGLLGAALVAVLAVVIPTSIVSYIKLSMRDLSCILEGSGWGLNSRMRLTRKQARTFTLRPPYPSNAKGVFLHQYSGRIAAALLIIAVALILFLLVRT